MHPKDYITDNVKLLYGDCLERMLEIEDHSINLVLADLPYATTLNERNKDPELSLKERNTSTIVLLEDRKYGRSGTFKLYYDIATGDYTEPPEGFLDSEEPSISKYLSTKRSF